MLGTGFAKAVVDNSSNLIFVKDRESRIVYANDAFLQIYSPEERQHVVGSTTVSNFSDDEAAVFLEEDRRAFDLGDTEIVEEVIDWRGDLRILCTHKTKYLAEDGRELLLAVAVDITELKMRERALTRANRQLRDYAHSVAHDLRTPIAAIVSGVSIIQRDPNSVLSERSGMVANAMKDSAHGMSKHLTAMLNAAQSDRIDLTFEETDLNLLLEEVRFNLSALFASKNAKLVVSRLPKIVVEPTLFRQLLQGLIENAVRHSGSDHPVVKLRYDSGGGEYAFSFFDNGPGIPAEKKHLLLRAATKDDGMTSTDGYGLGLAQSQRIAQLHEGYLEIPEPDGSDMDQPTIIARISAELTPR